MTYFTENIFTLEDLKAEYRKLCMANHPDLGGDTETMQEINRDYEAMFARVRDQHRNKNGEIYTRETQEAPEEFVEIINKVIHMDGVILECVGTFVWLTGNTKPFKDQIKEMGFKWANAKAAWYLAPVGYKRFGKKQYDLNTIRGMYGVQYEQEGKGLEQLAG